MTINERIKAARKAAGMTQAQLAEKIGSATITIQQYEAGKRQPRIEQLQKIASALGLYASDLVDGTKEGWQSLNTENAFRGVSDKLKDEIEEDIDIAHVIATIVKSGHETIDIHVSEDGYEQKATWAFVDIVNSYNKLNAAGRSEALKRIRELVFIPEYQRKEN